MQTNDRLNPKDVAGGYIGRPFSIHDALSPRGVFTFDCHGPRESYRAEAFGIQEQLTIMGFQEAVNAMEQGGREVAARLACLRRFWEEQQPMPVNRRTLEGVRLARDLATIPREDKWQDTVHNLVTTQGKNDLLDRYIQGSGYTATFYMGLISSVSYTLIDPTDTGAQINGTNGWTEAGLLNAPTYSQTTRPAPLWGAAAAGVKATSSFVVFTVSGAGTVKGSFIETSNTKDGAGGILFSAGLFTQGDRIVAPLDSLNGTYSLTV